MANVNVGTDVDALVPEITPGGQQIRAKGRGRANAGSGTKVIIQPPGQPVTIDNAIFLDPIDAVTMNHSGTNVSIADFGLVNAAFPVVKYAFPAEADDDNSMYWAVPVPTDMAAVPNVRIKFHLYLG